MALVVQKYGGTSVGDLQKIREVAKQVAARVDGGDQVVVVLSAMEGETDRLLDMALKLTDEPDGREIDQLIANGERISISLLTLALQSMGYKAKSLTGRQVGIITDTNHTNARIISADADKVRRTLEEGCICVVAGFQGISLNDDVTTLGRGGSDTTAVALAAATGAEVCEIYTDVDGIYTADPSVVPSARRLKTIFYDEMLELASLGAKVLHARSVEFGKRYGVPILVKSAFGAGEGTMVVERQPGMEEVTVAGVTSSKDQAKVTILGVPDRPGIAAIIFETVAEHNVVVDMIVQNISEEGLTDISFTVSRDDAERTQKLMREVAKEIGARDTTLDTGIVKVSIVGAGMRSAPGVAARMFRTLANEGINIIMISTSEIKVSCIVEEKFSDEAVRVLHEAFEEASPPAGGE
ncbi:MAG: aspartate kinase [Nitrospinae bacterium]|nr:aspartate kinase [Nitrospinota bacterium]